MPNFKLPHILESKDVFKESLLTIRRDKLQLENGHIHSHYTLMTHPFAVVILAITPTGEYILTQEYRHSTGNTLLGCPGGYISDYEEPIRAAERELLEETGYQASRLELMGSAYPYAGISSQKTFYIKAIKAKQVAKPQLEPSEMIQTILKTKKELYQMIREEIELDGPLCTALFFDSVDLLRN